MQSLSHTCSHTQQCIKPTTQLCPCHHSSPAAASHTTIHRPPHLHSLPAQQSPGSQSPQGTHHARQLCASQRLAPLAQGHHALAGDEAHVEAGRRVHDTTGTHTACAHSNPRWHEQTVRALVCVRALACVCACACVHACMHDAQHMTLPAKASCTCADAPTPLPNTHAHTVVQGSSFQACQISHHHVQTWLVCLI